MLTIRRARTLRVLVTAVATIGCASPADLDDIVAAHVEGTALTYRDCGEVSYGFDQTACAALTPAEQCFVDSFDACIPAMIRVTKSTIEGDPIPAIVLVDTHVERCTITQFVDRSADAYKGNDGDVQQYSCARLQVPENGCVVPVADQCTFIRDW